MLIMKRVDFVGLIFVGIFPIKPIVLPKTVSKYGSHQTKMEIQFQSDLK